MPPPPPPPPPGPPPAPGPPPPPNLHNKSSGAADKSALLSEIRKAGGGQIKLRSVQTNDRSAPIIGKEQCKYQLLSGRFHSVGKG